MLITNENAPIYVHDRVLQAVMLRFLPKSLHPNHITVVRFILIPFVLWFVVQREWGIAVPVFAFAAFTDAVDGSLARIRKQITVWGTIADPLADKLLIGSVAVVFVTQELGIWFTVVIVTLEMMIGIRNIFRLRRGQIHSANIYGKMKMLFQVIGVTSLLVHQMWPQPLFVPLAVATLVVGMVLACVSFVTYGP